MKNLLVKLTVAAAALLVSATCHAQKIFNSLADNPNVESVFVGKAMINMGINMLGNDNMLGDDNYSKDIYNAITEIESIEIICCEVPKEIAKIKSQAAKILAKLKLQTLIETKEDGETVVIYGHPHSNGDTISDMVIETTEKNEYNLIHIKGKINVKALTSNTKK